MGWVELASEGAELAWAGVSRDACLRLVLHGVAWHGLVWYGLAWRWVGVAWAGMRWARMACVGVVFSIFNGLPPFFCPFMHSSHTI